MNTIIFWLSIIPVKTLLHHSLAWYHTGTLLLSKLSAKTLSCIILLHGTGTIPVLFCLVYYQQQLSLASFSSLAGQGCGWIRIRMDLHSFSVLDLDPGGENLRENRKNARTMKKKKFFYYKILTKCGQTPLFINFEQSFLSISTLYLVICYKFC